MNLIISLFIRAMSSADEEAADRFIYSMGFPGGVLATRLQLLISAARNSIPEMRWLAEPFRQTAAGK